MSAKAFFIISLFSCVGLWGQNEVDYKVRSIFFYNVENLFDTINDPSTLDDSRTPAGKDKWTGKRYSAKLDRITEVLTRFGLKGRPVGPDIIGLCEVENYGVLQDLINHPRLLPFNYGIIHEDSPDRRGIDVGLIFKKNHFSVTAFRSHHLFLRNEKEEIEYTRDQLVVSGFLDSEEIFLIINHWPSRRGGEKSTKPLRAAAARLTRKIIDSISHIMPDPKIIVMGDFNDNPIDDSIKRVLKTTAIKIDPDSKTLFNPMEDLYSKGIGSLAYRDQWSLFDQIIVSHNLLSENDRLYTYWKAGVYNAGYLITLRGRFKGYPNRTYAAGVYQGGYSDHLPVYLLLVKKND
ncbi:MAG: endonuclease/exonuclease/phosphatase family protein [Flavobacteriaceae bacterium]